MVVTTVNKSSLKTKCSNYHCRITNFLNFVQHHSDLKLCRIQSKEIIHQLRY